MNVLLSAYACEPGKGSEPSVGWNIVREVSKYNRVWVLTSSCHRQAIEAELISNPQPNLHFVYLDPIGWVLDWINEGKITRWGVHLHYYLWQVWAYFITYKLHKQIAFDIVHHVTYVTYCKPSFLSMLPVPFLWGPIGGGESAPNAFYQDLSLRGQVFETLRSTARWIGECDPFVRLTAHRSLLAWATTEDTAIRLRQIGAKNIQLLSQLGLSKDEIKSLGNYPIPESSKVRFISVGRLLHWKGFHLGLKAFAQANIDNAEYWIVGNGPERQRLESLAENLGITETVKFLGSFSRERTLDKIGDCHVLVHPSLHDSGGLVCLEAMAAGRPVICLDLGGPAVQVTEETGIKVPANKPEQAINDIAKAMNCLAKEPELRIQMGEAGKKIVNKLYNWKNKGKQLTEIYQTVVNATVAIK